MLTPVEVIRKFVDTLTKTNKTGEDAVDEAFKAVGVKGNYTTFYKNFEKLKAHYDAKQYFLEQVCGVRLNNKDTGAITGSDAGGKTIKTAESIIPETANAVNLTNEQYNSFTKNGLTVNVTYKNATFKTYNWDDLDPDYDYGYDIDYNDVGHKFDYSNKTYLAKQKFVVRALYNWWIPESLNLIDESLGINFTDGRASINKLDIEFVDGYSPDMMGEETPYKVMELSVSYDMGRASSFKLTVDANALYNIDNIDDRDRNGTLDEKKCLDSKFSDYDELDDSSCYTNYLDRLFLQALTEMALDANLNYIEELPEEIPNALWKLVGGFDDYSTDYGYFYHDELPGYHYAVLRYLTKNYSDRMPDGLSYNKNKTVLTASTNFKEKTLDLDDFASTVKNVNATSLKKAVYIVGNALANSIKGGTGADTISGGDGNDKIFGNAGNDSLLGNSGDDTLSGGKGNDTLNGGAGNDIFIYSAGKDVITDYASGDKISLGAAISKSSISGSDVIFTIGSGSLTVKNGKAKSLSMINSSGKSFSTIIGGNSSTSSASTTVTVTDKTKSPVTVGSAVKTIDAAKRTKAVKITGNALANTINGGSKNDTISGGAGNDMIYGNAGKDKLYGNAGNDVLYGGAGNDSLWGGAGNDTLWGNNGNDTFIFWAGGGTDYIMDYASGEALKILNKDGTANTTFGNSSFSDDILTLTINGGGTIILNDVESSTEFNINGTSYKISGSKLAKK